MHPVALTQQTILLEFLTLQNLLKRLTLVSKFDQRFECYLLTLYFIISKNMEDRYRVKIMCILRISSSKLSLCMLTDFL